MKVKQVLERYHAIVPFPWTVEKITIAGRDAGDLVEQMKIELSECDNLEEMITDAIGAWLQKMAVEVASENRPERT